MSTKTAKKPVDLVRERARRRMIVRLAGVVLVLLGVAIVMGEIALPRLLGVVFVAFGVFDVAIMPTVMNRKWRRMGQ